MDKAHSRTVNSEELRNPTPGRGGRIPANVTSTHMTGADQDHEANTARTKGRFMSASEVMDPNGDATECCSTYQSTSAAAPRYQTRND
jgi:hypothetical protein